MPGIRELMRLKTVAERRAAIFKKPRPPKVPVSKPEPKPVVVDAPKKTTTPPRIILKGVPPSSPLGKILSKVPVSKPEPKPVVVEKKGMKEFFL